MRVRILRVAGTAHATDGAGELERLLAEMTAIDSVRLEASGRTDTGFMLALQIAHVDLPKGIDPVHFRRGLNAQLSGDIRVVRVQRVSDSFHARFDAKEKEYRYFIYNGLIVPPPLRCYRLQEGRRLDRCGCSRLRISWLGRMISLLLLRSDAMGMRIQYER